MAKVLFVEGSNFSTVLKHGIEMKMGFEEVFVAFHAETGQPIIVFAGYIEQAARNCLAAE